MLPKLWHTSLKGAILGDKKVDLQYGGIYTEMAPISTCGGNEALWTLLSRFGFLSVRVNLGCISTKCL